VNGVAVSQRVLRELGGILVDVNGQQAAQSLRYRRHPHITRLSDHRPHCLPRLVEPRSCWDREVLVFETPPISESAWVSEC
jgi:hypothetical protein